MFNLKYFASAMAILAIAFSLSAQTATRKVTLSWADSQTDVTYNAYRAPGDCTGTPTFAKLNTAPIAVKTYEDIGPPEGTYCYTVRAERDTLESGNSNLASANVGPPPVVPPPVVPTAPTGVSVTVSVTVTVQP